MAHSSDHIRLPVQVSLPIVLGTLLNALNSSMIAVALVDIQSEFAQREGHAALGKAIWLVSGLYLATAVAQPVMGRLAENFGARGIFMLGLAIVLVSAIFAPFVPTIDWLIATRVGLGIGTSAAYPAGMAMLREWAEQHAAGALPTGGLGAISIAAQVAVAFGPPLGGILVQWVGWRSIFWVNVPIVMVAAIMALRWLPADPPRRPRSWHEILRQLDLPGIGLFIIAMICLLMFLRALAAQPDWWLAVAAVACFAWLYWHERHTSKPLIDVRMLAGNRALVGTYLRCMATYLVFYTIYYALPKWLEEGRGASAGMAGLMLLPIALLGVVSTLLATPMVSRKGARQVLIIGSALLCVGGIGLSGMSTSIPGWSIFLIACLFGIPNGFNNLGNQTTLYQSAPREQTGTASGLYRTAQYVGGSLSFALVGLILGHPASDSGLHHLSLVVTAISGVLLINAMFGQLIMPKSKSASILRP